MGNKIKWIGGEGMTKDQFKELVSRAPFNARSFKEEYLCDPVLFEQRPLTDKQTNKLGKRFNDTIERRRDKDGPIVIITSRLNEQDDPGFTID